MAASVQEGQAGVTEESILTYLGWDEIDVLEFQCMWDTMKDRGADGVACLASSMLLWILENVPSVRELFHAFDVKKNPRIRGSCSDNNVRFMKHAMRIVQQLDHLVSTLNRPEQSLVEVRKFVRDHIDREVQLRHFEDFRDRFHLFLFEIYGAPKSSRMVSMWYTFWDGFIKVYREERMKIKCEQRRKCQDHCCLVL